MQPQMKTKKKKEYFPLISNDVVRQKKRHPIKWHARIDKLHSINAEEKCEIQEIDKHIRENKNE